jgi:predicted alpha/beta superfamily hydrolase
MTLPAQAPALLYRSTQFDVLSAISGRIYRIFVFKPAAPPQPSGYPVVLVTDGNLTFPLAATMDAAFGFQGGNSAVLVGIGYATDDPMELLTLRTRDLTPPTPLSGIPHKPGLPPIKLEDYGGSENFYGFLMEELLPAIAAAYPLNSEDKTLFGHSWGGLFTLGVLLKHPKSFRNFVISSPSIWWNNRSVLDDAAGFASSIQSKEVAPRVLILVGSKEQDVPATLPPAMTEALRKKIPFVPSALRSIAAKILVKRAMLDFSMVDNARSLAARLQEIKGGPGYLVRFHAFDGEDHLTALSASIGRALAFALRS